MTDSRTYRPLDSRVIIVVERENGMSIRRIKIERFGATTSKPFEAVVAALKAQNRVAEYGVGRLDLAAFANVSKSPSR